MIARTWHGVVPLVKADASAVRYRVVATPDKRQHEDFDR